MSKLIILPVKARHFKDADFADNNGCAIANAAKEFFSATVVGEGVNNLDIYNPESIFDYDAMRSFSHEYYGRDRFDGDKIKAEHLNYDETIIFELELKEK